MTQGFQCDKCERFVSVAIHYYQLVTDDVIDRFAAPLKFDLCEDCYDDVRDFMGLGRVKSKPKQRKQKVPESETQ
jgi:hypothetical protein